MICMYLITDHFTEGVTNFKNSTNPTSPHNLDWNCKQTWRRPSYNTLWCLIGCSIGGLGTIAYFQYFEIGWSTLAIMGLAIINGLITSIILATFILFKQMSLLNSFKTACGMSLISMIAMEIAMNLTDIFITGGARPNRFMIPPM